MNWVSRQGNSNQTGSPMTTGWLYKLLTWLRWGFVVYQMQLRIGVSNY